jgi:hypothetical protein
MPNQYIWSVLSLPGNSEKNKLLSFALDQILLQIKQKPELINLGLQHQDKEHPLVLSWSMLTQRGKPSLLTRRRNLLGGSSDFNFITV